MANTNDPQKRIASKEALSLSGKVKKYPSDLSEKTVPNVTCIKIFEYTKKSITEIEKTSPLGTIFLPIASNLQYLDSHEWEEFDGGVVQTIADGGRSEAALGLGATVAGKTIERIGQGSTAKSTKVVQAESGVTLNPKRSNVYVTPKFREFQLEYSFVARNASDSKNIKDIENILRYYASPENVYTAGQFLKAPALFLIKHISSGGEGFSENNYLPKYLPAALMAVNVAYNSNGDNYLHRNTFAPIDVKITLAFKELEYDTKETLKERYKVSDDNMWS